MEREAPIGPDMSDRTFSKKRSRWVVWLPTFVVLAIIAAAGVLAWQVASGNLGRDAPPSVEEAVTADGYSRYSEDGLAYIRDSLQARVDLSERSPDASELGLPADGGTVVETDGFSVSVGLYVGEESIRIPTDSMTLTTKDGRLVGLTLATSSQGYQGQSALLASVAERFAIDTGPITELDSAVADNVRSGESEEYTFGPGTGFGRPTTATVSVFGGEGTALAIDVDFAS
jgi:hypothetical protein